MQVRFRGSYVQDDREMPAINGQEAIILRSSRQSGTILPYNLGNSI
jgi:hypothetical protein